MRTRLYHFVIAFSGECCLNPHLWATSAKGKHRSAALQVALKEVREGGNQPFEVIQVGSLAGDVCEVEDV